MSHPTSAAERMTEAANRFLSALDIDQLELAHRPFSDHDERHRWFYTPTDHGGITGHEMSPPQHRAMFQLMATGLSTAGYVTASTIMGLENILDHTEGFTMSWGRSRARDPHMYYVRIFGEPGDARGWGWRIGGHHISLNFTLINGQLAGTTPLFLGADPASSPLLGPHPLRPLEGVEDLARELARSLDEGQRDRAIVSAQAPSDLILGNRAKLNEGDNMIPLRDIWRSRLNPEFDELAVRIQDAFDRQAGLSVDDVAALAWSATPKGLPAREMNEEQREMLDTLLRRYANRLPDELADAEVAKFSGEHLLSVHLMWAGSREPGMPHYYRLHSPTVLAEYDNSARNANHVHTVWRDPRGDFGADALAHHHATHDHA